MIARRLLVLPVALSCLLPTAAQAQWSASASGSAELAASTMTNATGFAAACTTSRPKSTVTLTWTPSPDVYVDGYVIVRTASGGGIDQTITVQGNVSGTTDAPATGPGISYTYAIRATGGSWTTPLLAASGTLTYSRNGCATA